ncbi:hypothetical protein LZ30DRAFT_483629 [Colletotrichum cereale]|nr:hypothetical protein LZ30DRAFT_483629 [Colletotrichum cereale]
MPTASEAIGGGCKASSQTLGLLAAASTCPRRGVVLWYRPVCICSVCSPESASRQQSCPRFWRAHTTLRRPSLAESFGAETSRHLPCQSGWRGLTAGLVFFEPEPVRHGVGSVFRILRMSGYLGCYDMYRELTGGSVGLGTDTMQVWPRQPKSQVRCWYGHVFHAQRGFGGGMSRLFSPSSPSRKGHVGPTDDCLRRRLCYRWIPKQQPRVCVGTCV